MEQLEKLNEGLLKLGIEPAHDCYEKVLLYTEELINWSQKINLTAIKKPEDIIVKHFLDSLVCLKEIDAGSQRILDIGTGAGFPGLPLKIFKPELQLFLLEATGKKVKFLEHLLDRLRLESVVILHCRAEDLCKKVTHQEMFDVVVTRAVGELRLLVKISFPFLKKEGCLLALKGTNIGGEIKRSQIILNKLKGTIETVKDYELLDGRKGKLVKIRKV